MTNNTVCPTRYRTRHFFNNCNTNEDIATKFEQECVSCVRNEEECNFDVRLTVHRSSMWIKRPTRCRLVIYLFLLYNLLNMFRATLCPSSGADDLVVFFSVLQSRGCVGSQIRLAACLSIGKHLAVLSAKCFPMDRQAANRI